MQLDQIRSLISHQNSDINSTTENGESCLILATKLQNEEIIEQLLKAGADVHQCDKGGNTAMYYARIEFARSGFKPNFDS